MARGRQKRPSRSERHRRRRQPARKPVSELTVRLPERRAEPETVIAHLGLEVNDSAGKSPAGIVQLHIATGFGRKVPAEVDGKDYLLYTPTGIVLHSKDQLSTSEWYDKNSGQGKVREFDK